LKSSTFSSNLAADSWLPCHENLNASFFYNFYTNDEFLVESTVPALKIYKNERDLIRRSPRFVKISFNKQSLVPSSVVDRTNEVRQNIQKVYSVEDIGNSSYTSLISQDSSISDRIFQTIMRSATIRGISGNMSDISMELGRQYGSSLDRELLQDLSISYQNAGAEFVNDRKSVDLGKFKRVESFSSFITINDKFIYDIMKGVEENSTPGNSISVSLSADETLAFQKKARSSSASISSIDFITTLVPVSVNESTDGEFISGIEQVATLVYRQEQLPNGKKEERLLDVLTPDKTTYIDYSVKLGSQYNYWCHAVYVAKIGVLAEDTEQILRAEVLFQSAPSNSSIVFALDSTPPKHPSDFNITWDYQTNMLALSWNFPPNRRQDIKYFQIFRRKKVSEPFELLAEYDFNDALKQPARFENVNTSLVQKMSDPMTVYIDKEFSKSSNYIYCIASVDARGKVSNYSEQMDVSFDIIRNRLVKKVISVSGAPRQYPNVFLKKSFFHDAIFSSKKRRAVLYFDPEYLQIKSSNGGVIDSVIMKEVGSYTMNVLDTTRGQSSSTIIEIDNLLET
jgi:hypothetical protein